MIEIKLDGQKKEEEARMSGLVDGDMVPSEGAESVGVGSNAQSAGPVIQH